MAYKNKTVTLDSVEYVIDSENQLIRMRKYGPPKDVFIPSVFPSDERIKSIGHHFTEGLYLTITVDNSISQIDHHAFTDAKAQAVVWPDSCLTIPAGCFVDSTISCVKNTDHVESIGNWAFNRSNITTFKWPSKCRAIPKACFASSKLKDIQNIQNISSIGTAAFWDVSLNEKLDLSKSELTDSDISDSAFAHFGKEMVILPYYVSKDVFHSSCDILEEVAFYE